jgi:hypothetical protein
MKKDILFDIIDQPRTAAGGFGEAVCEKCGANSTVFLKIMPCDIILCKGCLWAGEEMINNGILKQAFKGRLY